MSAFLVRKSVSPKMLFTLSVLICLAIRVLTSSDFDGSTAVLQISLLSFPVGVAVFSGYSPALHVFFLFIF